MNHMRTWFSTIFSFRLIGQFSRYKKVTIHNITIIYIFFRFEDIFANSEQGGGGEGGGGQGGGGRGQYMATYGGRGGGGGGGGGMQEIWSVNLNEF